MSNVQTSRAIATWTNVFCGTTLPVIPGLSVSGCSQPCAPFFGAPFGVEPREACSRLVKASLKRTVCVSAHGRWQETVLEIILAEWNLHIFLGRYGYSYACSKKKKSKGCPGPMKKNSQNWGPLHP